MSIDDRRNPPSETNTTGPWKVYTTDKGTYIGVGDAEGQRILDHGFGLWGSDDEKKYNAELIVNAVNAYLRERKEVMPDDQGTSRNSRLEISPGVEAGASPSPHLRGDGEASIIECLAAGQNFVFDPATNFLHADDGTVQGIRYIAEHGDMPHVPWPASEWAIERIAKLEAALGDLMTWFPDEPSQPEWRIRAGEQGADDAVAAARAALTTEGQP